ncbi:hypothetical protein RHMOL_Rhmol08G0189800 [Rhododendron molle]|uniref:Uncharacterized protein n=1 Tax=Rhododendron molle TaxID=49168 RepID=A0ACC0MQA7_RHOML|nr:hypothetical protein RHMOL_Rhmol08G0189800 [Rhododendron molle]
MNLPFPKSRIHKELLGNMVSALSTAGDFHRRSNFLSTDPSTLTPLFTATLFVPSDEALSHFPTSLISFDTFIFHCQTKTNNKNKQMDKGPTAQSCPSADQTHVPMPWDLPRRSTRRLSTPSPPFPTSTRLLCPPTRRPSTPPRPALTSVRPLPLTISSTAHPPPLASTSTASLPWHRPHRSVSPSTDRGLPWRCPHRSVSPAPGAGASGGSLGDEKYSIESISKKNFRSSHLRSTFQLLWKHQELLEYIQRSKIQNPVLINQHEKWLGGKRFEDKFMELLKKYGYKGSYLSKDWLEQSAFIQSFAPTSLIFVSNQTDLPKISLIDDVTVPTLDTNQSYLEVTSDAYFNYFKDYVVGIRPWKDTIVPVVNNYLQTRTDLVARAHPPTYRSVISFQVHPYTFQDENVFLHFDFHQDPYNEYEYWVNKMGVDGLFTDFTGSPSVSGMELSFLS